MDYEECLQKEYITKTIPDIERSKKILRIAVARLDFWKDKDHITLKVEAYYEIIKELILSHIYKNGYNCTNHICLVAYIREQLPDYESDKIDELRKVRNEISYRGFEVKKDYLERNRVFINN